MVSHLIVSAQYPGYLQNIWLLNGFLPDGFGSISRMFANCAKDIKPSVF
jgi:hypothetical protein